MGDVMEGSGAKVQIRDARDGGSDTVSGGGVNEARGKESRAKSRNRLTWILIDGLQWDDSYLLFLACFKQNPVGCIASGCQE